MWVKSYNKTYSGIKREDIWRIWQDVNNWPLWDKELEYCKIEGDFKEGSKFILKPIGAPKVKITLSEVVTNIKFTDYCKFLGAVMYDSHQLDDTPEGVRITSTITVTGLFQFIWVKLVASKVANSVPKQIDSLVALVKSR